MQKILPFILFIAIALAVYAGLHWFIYTRIAGGLELGATARRVLKIVLIAGAMVFPAGEFLARSSWSVPLLWTGYVWLGLLSIAFSLFLLEWLSGLFLSGGRRTAVIIALVLASGLALFSLVQEMRHPALKELRVPLRRLQERHVGFSIVQISDLHLGFHTPTGRVQWIVDRVKDMNPDLVVITGDLMDRDIGRQERFCIPLSRLRSRHGVYAVTGNHEYYAGIGRFRELAGRTGIRILGNESVRIGDVLVLAGVDDDQAADFRKGGPDLQAALSGADRDLPVILLYHRPERFLEARTRGVDLQLSGHTHAGQLPPMDLLVKLAYRYPYGLYQRDGAAIYTTCGTGTWGPPMRLFSRSEIVKIILYKP